MLTGHDHGMKRRRAVMSALASAAVPSMAVAQTVRPPIVNTKTARAIGTSLRDSFVARVDPVIR